MSEPRETRKSPVRDAIEGSVESILFASRWLLAPLYLGLVVGLVVILSRFGVELWDLVTVIAWKKDANDVVLGVLALLDIALLGNLILIVIFAGYENFVSKIGTGDHEDRPAWMGKVGFSDLKIKLIGAIVAISAVELLKAFINLDEFTWYQLSWKVGIHVTFVVSGVLFAITDRITDGKTGGH